MSCKGLHCPGCGDGGGGLAVVGLIALAVVAAVVYHFRHIIELVLEVIFWTIVGGLAVTAAGGLVYAGLRIRASVRARQPRAVIPARAEVVRLGVERTGVPAIEAPRPRAASWPLPGQWDEIKPRTERSS